VRLGPWVKLPKPSPSAPGAAETCDLRTITLAGGSIIADETATDPHLPRRRCVPARPALEVGSASLTDTIVAGTGLYAGASGTLTGTVRVEASNLRPAGTSTVKLSGKRLVSPSRLLRVCWPRRTAAEGGMRLTRRPLQSNPDMNDSYFADA
jgi:hypothetical protein